MKSNQLKFCRIHVKKVIENQYVTNNNGAQSHINKTLIKVEQ